MNRCALALVSLALSALVACSGDDEPTEPVASSPVTPSAIPTAVAASASPSASPLASAPASASASAGAPPAVSAPPSGAAPPATPPQPSAAAPGGPARVAFPADTRDDLAPSSGGPVGVRAVRVARRSGYDRIVFELAGRRAGRPGWRVGYVDSPARQGSGEPVRVRGRAVLSVHISGTGYPMDTGVEEVSGEPPLPRDLRRITDVVLGGVFEGEYEAFVGTSARAPFRVFRLADPARVVIDVRD